MSTKNPYPPLFLAEQFEQISNGTISQELAQFLQLQEINPTVLEYIQMLAKEIDFNKIEAQQQDLMQAFALQAKNHPVNFFQEVKMRYAKIDLHHDTFFDANFDKMHSHTFYEIILCESDRVHYMLDGKQYLLMRGDILIVPPAISHRPLYLEDEQAGYHRYAIWLNRTFLDDIIAGDALLQALFTACTQHGTYLLRSKRSYWEPMQAMCHEIAKLLALTPPAWELSVLGNGYLLLGQLTRMYRHASYAAADALAEQGVLAPKVIDYIEAHLCEKLTLAQVASHFYVSNSTISHLFTKQIGTPFYQYIIQNRLVRVKNAILNGTPITQSWQGCGFSDYASFYRAFKKEYGLSPRAFQQEYAIYTESKLL